MTVLLAQGCASRPIDCSRPEFFCVGLVTEVGRLDDKAYNQAAWEGVQRARTDGIADWIASIETVDARDYEENIRVFAEAGYDVIVTVGDAMGEATWSMAEAYPSVYFIGVDQYQTEDQEVSPNLAGLVFSEEQIGFLAGALAALMTQTGEVGAVCASQAWPPMKRYCDGFQEGAAYISPDVKVVVKFHDEVGFDKTFEDPKWGSAAASLLIDDGADILFGVGGTTGSSALVTATEQDAYAIGADTDQYYTLSGAAPHLLMSVLKLITHGTARLITLAKAAQIHNTIFPFGNYQGQIGLAPYHDMDSAIRPEVKARMSELTQSMLAGPISNGAPFPTAAPTMTP
jgi:basic membrane protein A